MALKAQSRKALLVAAITISAHPHGNTLTGAIKAAGTMCSLRTSARWLLMPLQMFCQKQGSALVGASRSQRMISVIERLLHLLSPTQHSCVGASLGPKAARRAKLKKE